MSFFGLLFIGGMVWGTVLFLIFLTRLIAEGDWKTVAFIVGAIVAACVVGLMLGQFFAWVSISMSEMGQ
jgi:hypothetical protein